MPDVWSVLGVDGLGFWTSNGQIKIPDKYLMHLTHLMLFWLQKCIPQERDRDRERDLRDVRDWRDAQGPQCFSQKVGRTSQIFDE